MNESGIEHIEWPALRFGSPNCAVTAFESGELLSNASARTLKVWKRMHECFVIDTQGNRHDLACPEFVDPPKSWRRLISGLNQTKRPVRWKKVTVRKLDADDLRKLIEANFDQYHTVWHAYDLDELKRRLASAKSIADIMALFLK
jgi:hypothetical protein